MDPVGAKLLDVAEKELGYREKAGGYTKYGSWYGKTYEDGDGYYSTAPWCDMFLTWAAAELGVQDWVGEFASTVDHATWFEKHDAWGTKPEPGALVFFSWSGSKDIGSIEHVGLVESVKGSKLHTIEANTDGVYLKRQTRDLGDVVGYGYPGKVKVAGKSLPDTITGGGEKTYVAKHAAPVTAANAAEGPRPGDAVTSQHTAPKAAGDHQVVQPEALLGGLLAVAVCGTAALTTGKAMAARVPTEAPVRVRRRGRHHKRPVALPADLTPADLDAAEAGTALMPAISAAVAAEAEEREFWSRVSTLQEDKELAFWDTLHAELAPIWSDAAGRTMAGRR
ncbi:CHAP domain-containing protein [Actinomadura opuntiae]|uniref:CHAP domain-containing protein n=1 Tax=Actinomadura sp. OS1-43 TaxID=604315 RepID=UPI00255B0491|nr:CHAP domain-containing protein [Actinomadura sp. OS1-43]MDL4815044.1 CHAP domain-containing protein [Actinomadura sp. OS1-43]